MEDGLEQNMLHYNRTDQTQDKKTVYLCILNEDGETKKYVIIDNIKQVREFTKNITCEIKICKMNDI